jgi:ribonuclease HI
MLIKQWPDAEIEKGKMVVDDDLGFQKKRIERQKARKRWIAPTEGNAKLNVDGAFDKAGAAGIGVALRDHKGDMILSACKAIDHCRDATEAELMAIEEGLKLSLTWTTKQFSVETDCAVLKSSVSCSVKEARFSSRSVEMAMVLAMNWQDLVDSSIKLRSGLRVFLRRSLQL